MVVASSMSMPAAISAAVVLVMAVAWLMSMAAHLCRSLCPLKVPA
jgi:hypothetical protein